MSETFYQFFSKRNRLRGFSAKLLEKHLLAVELKSVQTVYANLKVSMATTAYLWWYWPFKTYCLQAADYLNVLKLLSFINIVD